MKNIEVGLNRVLGVIFIIGGCTAVILGKPTDPVGFVIGILCVIVGGRLALTKHKEPIKDTRTYYDDLPEDVQYFLCDLNANLGIAMCTRKDPNIFTDPNHTLDSRLDEIHIDLQPFLEDRP